MTTEYSYHHGYWEGFEREFRGFGRVDQRDTQVFALPYFSPPTETRTWFHQGDIGDAYSGWRESDNQDGFAAEYFSEPWPGFRATAQVLSRPPSVVKYLGGLDPSVKRDAFRSLRGKILRTELYALDGTARQSLPYTVTEHVYFARQEAPANGSNPPVFFPFLLSERTTQWERGSDPLTTFKFSDNCDATGRPLDYDAYGQLLSRISVAVPRGRTFQDPGGGPPYLATQSVTTYAQPTVIQTYIVDRTTSVTNYEVVNDGSLSVFALVQQIQGGSAKVKPIGHTLNFYDGTAFQGLPFGQIGSFGALVRTDNLVMTGDVLEAAYGTDPPPYISDGAPAWTADYPTEFQTLLPPCAGYTYQKAQPGSAYQTGYYRSTIRRKYDFQDGTANPRGLLLAKQDALGHQTTITYDAYDLLPATVTDAAELITKATYDYRVSQPALVTDPNGNQSQYAFSPLGLLASIAVMGQPGQSIGDTTASPGTVFAYTFFDSNGTPVADLVPPQPISVETTRRVYHVSQTAVPEPQREQTIAKIEYSDGFGRVLQTRTQAEDTLFGDPLFGDTVLPTNQSDAAGTSADVTGRQRDPADPVNVVVSGWQSYDNKGQVVEKFEPFFSVDWAYGRPGDAQMGEKITLYYDPRGHLIRTANPDGSEQRVVYGVPGTIAAPDLSDPDVYEPSPWEAYTYDPDDNAGRTDPIGSIQLQYQYQWNTPSSIVMDALGRTVLAVQCNRKLQADGSWSAIVEYDTASTYDIRGNLLAVVDAFGRTAFAHAYDFANRALLTTSIDGGNRSSVLDAANNLVEQRDSKGALILHSYDVLNRAIRVWACDAEGQTVGLRERIIYGDDSSGSGLTQPQAIAANLLGKPYKHYDEAGLLTFAAYDFKGNLLDSVRSVIAESALLAVFDAPPANWALTPFRVDWGGAKPPPLDATNYESTTAYDALNRIMTMQYPQSVDGVRKLLTPQYNTAGALESVTLNGAAYVDRIAYNAKGQRVLIAYGNGQMTRYAYDPQTFRLLRMRTEPYTKSSASTYHPSAPVAPLQDFGYVYDLVGNVLAIYDRTPGSGVQNSALGPNALNRNFLYDPVYRLISASGRECDMPPPPPPWTDAPRCADITKARSYTETYQYDNVGNMALWGHTTTDTAGNRSTTNRQFALVSGNNRLAELTVGSTAYQYAYDSNGNLVQENTERHFEWDESDRMRVFRIQPDSAPPSIYTQYLYDSDGQRVMKLTRNQAGGYEATIYIGGVFEERRNVSGATTVENSVLHVMDNKSRVATVRVGPALPGDGAADVPIQYHFDDHLGSSNVVVNDIGAWINREEYLPYGETSFGSFARKRYRFTGKERDEESGLTYHGARYYAPWLARWTSCDPAGTTEPLQLYCFVRCNPLMLVDPNGRAPTLGSTFLAGVRTQFAQILSSTAKTAVLNGLTGGLYGNYQAASTAIDAYREGGGGAYGLLNAANAVNPVNTLLTKGWLANEEAGQALYLDRLGDREGAEGHAAKSGAAIADYAVGSVELGMTVAGGVGLVRKVGLPGTTGNQGLDLKIKPSPETPLQNASTWADILAEDFRSEIDKAPLSNRQYPSKVGVGIDRTTGQIYYGTSGENRILPHPDTPYDFPSKERWNLNQCAEYAIQDRARWGSASVDDLTTSVLETASGASAPACHNCQITSQGATFTAGARP